MSMSEFRDYVTSRGVDFDTLTNEEKRQWSETFDMSKQQGNIMNKQQAPTEFNNISEFRNYPLYSQFLRQGGLLTPVEQYSLYGSFAVAIYGSYKPLRKAYFLNKWLHETDELLKVIWAGRVNLSETEQKAGKKTS
mmetsp:Transcript_34300/g.47131  ORF Transcript_34300/g.47131 Transcript_34300/m.47131 type:complete len:136 (-) Transcript_34300:145-552(-)